MNQATKEEMLRIFKESIGLKPISKIPNSVSHSEMGKEYLTADVPEIEEEVEEEEEPSYKEEIQEILAGQFTCPVDGKEFDNLKGFQNHWDSEHGTKYGAYKDFRKYKYPTEDKQLSNEDIDQMVKYWLIKNKKGSKDRKASRAVRLLVYPYL